MPKKGRNNHQPVAVTASSAQLPVFIQAPDFKTIYTNFVNAGLSPLDIILMVGEAIGPGPDGKPAILQRAKIIMTPVEAKIVCAILEDAVARYEKQFGKIVVRKDLMPVLMEGVGV